MRWRIEGVAELGGQAVTPFVIDAPTEPEAAKAARARGVMPSSIIRVDDVLRYEPVPPRPPPPSPIDEIPKNAKTVAWFGGVLSTFGAIALALSGAALIGAAVESASDSAQVATMFAAAVSLAFAGVVLLAIGAAWRLFAGVSLAVGDIARNTAPP
jgi:hypothetical protein